MKAVIIAVITIMFNLISKLFRQGKIIAVVGAPATGKSTLIRYLARHYEVNAFLEGEEGDLPDFVKENIEQNKNGLQTILFFHNQPVGQYLKALALRNKGKIVLLDTFWISNLFYLNSMLADKNERDLIGKLIFLTAKTFPLPDKILFIDAHDKTIVKRLKKRGRGFEKDMAKTSLRISAAHKKFFQRNLVNITIKIEAEKIRPNRIAKGLRLRKQNSRTT